MKLPRNISADDLKKALRRTFDHHFSRQVGSHRRLTSTQSGPQHHIAIPAHDPLKPGTPRVILGEVAAHHNLSVDDLLMRLRL